MSKTDTSPTAEFSVEYQGPAVDAGNMDVLDLAPALLALGRLCRETNYILNGDRAEISVQVHAQPRVGSFVVDLHLVQSVHAIYNYAHTLVGTQSIKDGKEILETIGVYADAVTKPVTGAVMAVHSLIGLVRAVKNRKITSTEKAGDTYNITIQGDVTLNVPGPVYNVYRNVEARQDLGRVFEPVTKEGITAVQFAADRVPQEKVEKKEAWLFQPTFSLAPEDETLESNRSIRVWQARTTATDPLLQWHFFEGQKTKINAYVRDLEFLRAMASREVIVMPGDILTVLVETTSGRNAGGNLVSRNEVLKVIATRPQLELPFMREDDDDDEPPL